VPSKIVAIFLTFVLMGIAGAAGDSRPLSPDTKQRDVALYADPLHPKTIPMKSAICPTCAVALRPMAGEVDNGTVSAANSAEPSNGDAPSISSRRIPDIRVYDQNGKQLKFYSQIIKGHTVAIDFIFTTCTTICPLLTVTFSKIQQNLADRAVRVQLISISVDPVTDTPARLRDFSAKFKVAPGWTFVTGNKDDIASLLLALEAGVGDKNDHTSRIVIGNDTVDYWTTASGSSSPAALVRAITDAASRQ
jgi:cytochrome oxidase Cu insertion factor (SCO1/SenC/PrrC family)